MVMGRKGERKVQKGVIGGKRGNSTDACKEAFIVCHVDA